MRRTSTGFPSTRWKLLYIRSCCKNLKAHFMETWNFIMHFSEQPATTALGMHTCKCAHSGTSTEQMCIPDVYDLCQHITNLTFSDSRNRICGSISEALLWSVKKWSNPSHFSIVLKMMSKVAEEVNKTSGGSSLQREWVSHLCPGWPHHFPSESFCSTGVRAGSIRTNHICSLNWDRVALLKNCILTASNHRVAMFSTYQLV